MKVTFIIIDKNESHFHFEFSQVELMSYPVLNLNAANAIFSSIGITITKHQLGYYEAKGLGYSFQNQKLLDLTHEILKQIVFD